MAEGRCINLTAEKITDGPWLFLGTQLSWGQENKKPHYFKKN